MARDADGVRRGAKWQANDASTDGQPSDLTGLYNAGDGWPSSYGEGGTDDPTRGEFNQVLKEITAVTTDVNKMGATLDWHSGISYEQDALVKRSQKFYRSRTGTGNLNKNPAQAANSSFWTQVFLNEYALEVASNAPTSSAGYKRLVFVAS